MKKAALFATILALALGASAKSVNFGALPSVSNPTLLPDGYNNLNWAGFYYVNPIWNDAGVGFKQGPNSLDVAFMGGGKCEEAGASCSASISSNSSAANALAGFQAQSAIVAAGYHSESINVSAYNNGQFVGSQNYNLSTSLQQINFPAKWGMITQLVMDTNSGTLVLYSLNLQSVGATAHGATSATGAAATSLDNAVGPTAPIHVLDPPKDGSGGGSARIGSGPVARGLEKTIADADIVLPPIIIWGPNAPKPRPVAHESVNAIADADIVKPPIIIWGPNAPKPRPVAHESETMAGVRTVLPQPIVISPTAPKKPQPVAHESETMAGVRTVLPQPIVISPTAPKKPQPVAHESETMAGVRTVLPQPIVISPTAPKKPGPVAHEVASANV